MGSRDVTVGKAAASRPRPWVRFARDRRGAVALAVVALLPVLIGFAGLGIEVGMWFWIQRQNQSAADAAAISAALEYAAHIESGIPTDPAAATAAATTTANCNLFSTSTSSSNPVCPLTSSASNTITLYPCYGFTVGGSCDTSGPPEINPNAVQVVLTQPLNTTFANLVTAIWGPSVDTVNVTTSAIAEFPSAGTACFLALDASAANAVLVGRGGALPNLNCWTASNSSSGSALSCNGCIIAGPTTVVGGDTVSNNGHLNGSPNRTYASAIADPYAAIFTHAFLTAGMPATPCRPRSIPVPAGAQTYGGNCAVDAPLPLTGTINLAAGTRIAGELKLIGNGTINLLPGTYWVTDGSLTLNGDIRCTGCSPGGPGVTIIFTTTQGSAGTIGTVLPSGNLAITLNAPGAGRTYAGLLMVQDPIAAATSGTIGGNPISALSGLIYFPKSNLSLVGNIQTDFSNCLVAVAKSLSVTGNINLNASGCRTAGLTTVPTILFVFLADSYG